MSKESVYFTGKEEFLSMRPRSMRSYLDKETLLASSNGDFQPIDNYGHTILTHPRNSMNGNRNEQFIRAASIVIRNPLCAIATKALQDEITSARFIVEERQGSTWIEQYDTNFNQLLIEPNAQWDTNDLLRAYVTHLPNFGMTQMCLFGKGDVMPNGSINQQELAIDIPFPTQMQRDLRTPEAEFYQYTPFYAKKPLQFRSDRVITDAVYNPLSPFYGISTPIDTLARIFEIDDAYTREQEDFFRDGGMAKSVLIRKIDMTKEGGSTVAISDDNVEEQVQKLYSQVNQRVKRNIVGLKGDWDLKQLGSGIDSLFQEGLSHSLQVQIAGAYGVPASLYLVGLKLSNQRASRQMDAIDFYARTIFNLMTRISGKFNRHIIPRFADRTKFRFRFDVSEMPLAQFTRLQDNREKERWFQANIINRGFLWEMLDLPVERLSEEEKKEMYGGNKGAGADLSNGTGSQSITSLNGND